MTAPLPEITGGALDGETLDALLADIGSLTRVLVVKARREAGAPADPADRLPLGEVRAELDAGRARAVQIRYLHAGEEWWDVLSRSGAGYRLVRIRQDPPPA